MLLQAIFIIATLQKLIAPGVLEGGVKFENIKTLYCAKVDKTLYLYIENYLNRGVK